MNTPLLQTSAWQNLQTDLKKTTFFEKTPDFSYLAILEPTKLGNYIYLPYGPVATTKSGFKKALASLTQLAKTKNAFFIRIEPQNLTLLPFLKSSKNCQKSTDLNPSHTWVLDLSLPETELIKLFPARLYRYYKKLEKSGLKIETSKNTADLKHLLNLQNALAKTKKFNTFSPHYLKTELEQPFSTLYLVKYTPEGQKTPKIISAGLVFDDKNTRYNLQGASDESFKKLHATGILTIQLILDAKQKGLKTFDFWGIAPDNTPKNHPWAGFTAFKKSFAGKSVSYCGTYDYVLNRKKYALYSLLRQLNRLRRRFN